MPCNKWTVLFMGLGMTTSLKARKSHAWQPSQTSAPGASIKASRSPLFTKSSFSDEEDGLVLSSTTRLARRRRQRQQSRSFWKQMTSSSVLAKNQLSMTSSVRHGWSTQLYSSVRKDDPDNVLAAATDDDAILQLEQLHRENRMLLDIVKRLEVENAELYQANVAARQQQKIILETFEGEGEEWCDELEAGMCPVEPSVSFGQAFRDRAYWLVGLLLLQSFSGIILARNESLIADHPFIVYFLTMLVGAGGNAGNQASVRVIRGLALGTLNPTTQNQFLGREFKMAICLSSVLTLAGFFRAAAFSTPFPETIAITTALFFIVFSSICFGAVLPLFLKKLGVDPAHSSTSIQVIMDILGVILAVSVSSFLLDSPLGAFLTSKLTSS